MTYKEKLEEIKDIFPKADMLMLSGIISAITCDTCPDLLFGDEAGVSSDERGMCEIDCNTCWDREYKEDKTE